MNDEDFRVALAMLHVTQADMARHFKTTRNTVSRWCNGINEIPYAVQLVVKKMLEEKERGAEDAKGESAQ
jgi:plasmid maintenance system antidote protein VapI